MKSRGRRLSEEKQARGKLGIPTLLTVWVLVVICFMSGLLLTSQPSMAPEIANEDNIGSWSDSFENITGIETVKNVAVSEGSVSLLFPIIGTDWTKKGLSMDVGAPEDYDYCGIGKGSVIRDYDGTYKLWYTGYDGFNRRIMYAESANGMNWVRHGVAIDLGVAGEPDDENALWPSVIKDNNAHPTEYFKMWYSGYDGEDVHIMYATSPDGLEWEKQGVVMFIDSPSETYEGGLYPSSVLKDEEGTYKMWYHGLGSTSRIHLATSKDGRSWTKHGVVLDVGFSGSLDRDRVFSPSVVLDENGIYQMWYTGGVGSVDRIFYASSFDGFKWFKQGVAVDIGPLGDYDSYDASELTVLKDWDGYYKMWYVGNDEDNKRMLYATHPLDSIEDYRFDFSTSSEGFTKETDRPYSEIYWDSQNQNVYVNADRQDTGDELFTKPLPKLLTTNSDSWTLSWRWSTTERGNWQWCIPLFISEVMDNSAYHDRPSIFIAYHSGDNHLGIPPPANYSVIYRGANDTLYLREYFYSLSNIEYRFNISYDAPSRNLAIKIRTLNDVTLFSSSYTIGTNPGDDFVFGKIGISSHGENVSEEPDIHGWVDDINFTISQNRGTLISNPIILPSGRSWSSLILSKSEPGMDNLIYVSVLDAKTDDVISGFENLEGTDIDISSIDPTIHPSIKLRAMFTGGASETPVLNEWRVTWRNDNAGLIITPDYPVLNISLSGPGLGIIGAISIVLLSLIFAGKTELGNYRMIPIIFPLYSRLRRHELLNQDTRNLIYRYITENPGDNYNSIKEKLNLNNGTLAYHLKTLERENYIKSMRDGRYKRFYPVDVKVQRVNGYGTGSVQGKIIVCLMGNPGLTQKGISGALGLSQQVVSYHLNFLIESGHVRAWKRGKTHRYSVNESVS